MILAFLYQKRAGKLANWHSFSGEFSCEPIDCINDYCLFRCDDNNAKIGDKMVYASTKDTVKKAFSGMGLEFQANDSGDMDYTTFADEVEKKA